MLKTRRSGITTRESGQALIVVAFGMIALLAAAGLAVDMGYLRYQRRLQQSAADSAALAGAAAAGTGGNVNQAATDDANLNGFVNGTLPNGAASTVTVTGPMAYNGQPNAVQVQISVDQPTFFMKIFGASMKAATVSTVATAQYTSARGCIFGLKGGGGITINGNVDIPTCGVLDAGNLSGTGHLTAATIGVSGGIHLATTPNAIPNVLQTPDPLINLHAPGGGGGGCTTVNLQAPPKGQPNNPVTLRPGNYCGITIQANFTQNVTMQPGIYRIVGGGGGANGLTFHGTGAVNGTNVAFYLGNGGGGITLHGNQRINLTPPTNGPLAGILFFQDRGNGAAATINGGAGSKMHGAFYFPSATLTVNGGVGTGAPYSIFVGKTVNLNTNINFTSDYTSLPNGSPIKSAVLVE